MKIIQINESDYVSYTLVNSDRTILAEAYSGDNCIGQIIFNMKEEIEESELELFTLREAVALYKYLQD